MGNIKQINIKNHTYYFFNDMINIQNFNSSLLKIDKKSYKFIDIYYIGYITIKTTSDYESINSVNPLNIGNEHLTFASTDKTKKLLKKYTELQNEIKNLNERMNDKSGEYGKNFMKIKFNPDVNLPLNKILKLHASLIG